MTSTQAAVVEKFGDLAFRERSLPPLPEDHVLVEVAGAAVNPADTYMCAGTYTMLPELPFTPGLEGAGVVARVGAHVSHLAVGDPVIFSITGADGGIAASSGSWAQHCSIRAGLAVRVPPGMDLVSAAAVPIAYLTAHRALFHVAGVQPTDRVLVRGASGAVGLAAVHLARHFGAPGRVLVGTASSEEGREAVRQRGGLPAGHKEEQVKEVASGESFDVIVELMANENLGSDLQLVAPGGRIAVIGSRPGGGATPVDARQALVKEATIRGVFLWKQTEEERKAAYRDIFAAFAGADQAAPSVRRFPLADAAGARDVVAAQARGEARTEGKVVLVVRHAPSAGAGSAREEDAPAERAGFSAAGAAAARAAARAARSAKTIDVHAHVVLEDTLGAAGSFGPEVGETDGKPWFRIGDYYLHGVKYVGSPFMDEQRRLARMDECGIDLQVLSPNPLTYFHHIPRDEAVAFCRRHNDALAALVSRHPHRLAGLAALPMQCPEFAVEELTRAVKELGLLGGYVGTDFGIALDDAQLDAFYARCCDLDVPLFMHPAPPGIDGPPGDPRLRRFELEIVMGFNLESTVAISTLIYGGVLDRHPKLDICFPSGGGAVACLAGRMACATTAPRPWVPPELRAPGEFHRRLRRLWLDTHVHDDGTLQLLRKHCGDDHLVFGTNFAGWDQEQGDTAPNLAGLDLAGNARRLLRLA